MIQAVSAARIQFFATIKRLREELNLHFMKFEHPAMIGGTITGNCNCNCCKCNSCGVNVTTGSSIDKTSATMDAAVTTGTTTAPTVAINEPKKMV